jgi:DHA1 family bicyclomycin/chloramphenicol resistance-like MFS transporter
VWALVTFRFLQGLGGGVGIVIARAVVRDRHAGVAAVRVFSLMMVVTGVAPIVAPLLGALLLQVTSWRAIFAFLGIAGALILAATAIGLPESLPHDRRRGSGLRATLTVFRGLATDRWFVGCTLACALPFGAMFAYIAGSPFVLQELYGLSPAAFGAVFGVNAVGLVCTALLGNRLVGHFGSLRLLLLALLAGCVGGVGLLVSVVAGVGLWGVLPSLFVVVSVIGIVLPNATALALADHPDVAGSASALLGVLTFLVGAAVAPLVGVAGADDALPLALVVAVLEVAALAQLLVLTRSARAN